MPPNDAINLAIYPRQPCIYVNAEAVERWNLSNFKKDKMDENALVIGIDYFFDFEEVKKFLNHNDNLLRDANDKNNDNDKNNNINISNNDDNSDYNNYSDASNNSKNDDNYCSHYYHLYC